jgi:hypothetical protein
LHKRLFRHLILHSLRLLEILGSFVHRKKIWGRKIGVHVD